MKPKQKKLLFLKIKKVRLISKRFAISVIFLIAIIMMTLTKNESVVIEKTSSASINIISPIVDVLSIPAKLIANSYNYLTSLKKTYEENNLLKKENQKLSYLKHRVNSLEIENKLLGELLNYIPPKEARTYSAKVIATENSAFAHSIIVYTGKNPDIIEGQVAVNDKGVVGRIDSVGVSYSQINLLTDINTKIPIIIERNRTRGILIGNNTHLNRIIFTPINADIKVGDTVITSGVAGIYPPGLPIGKVVSADKDIEVKPFADMKTIEYIQIIDYQQDKE